MSDTSVVTLDGNLVIDNWRESRAEVLAQGSVFTAINTDEELDVLSGIVKQAKILVKKLTEKRKEATAPAEEFKKRMIQIERAETKALDEFIANADAMMGKYALAKAREAEEERKRIEAEQAKFAEAEVERIRRAEEANAAFGITTATPATPMPMPTFAATAKKAKASNASFTEAWTYEIVNPNLVPRELCSPDSKKISEYLKSKKAEGFAASEIVVQGLMISTTMQVRSR